MLLLSRPPWLRCNDNERENVFSGVFHYHDAMSSHSRMSYLRFFVPFLLGIFATLLVVKTLSPGPAGEAVAVGVKSAPLTLGEPDVSDAAQEAPLSEPAKEGNIPTPQISMQPDPSSAFSTPIPEEWETPLFAILQQTNMAVRNQGLLNMATTSAAHVPRVQAECLKHLTYGLSEKNPNDFLAIIRNPAIAIRLRQEFLKETLQIRRKEFTQWLATTLAYDSQPEIAAASRFYLNQGN